LPAEILKRRRTPHGHSPCRVAVKRVATRPHALRLLVRSLRVPIRWMSRRPRATIFRFSGRPTGLRPLVAHCHLGLGNLYRRTGKREQAQEHLTAATTMYREMGMTYWLEKAAAESAELG
jgi:hypothetical protein